MGKRANRKRKETRKGSTIIVRRGDKTVTKESKVFNGCGCTTVPSVTVKGTPVNNGPLIPKAEHQPISGPLANRQVGFVPGGKPYVPPKPEPSFWETGIEEEMVKSCGVFDEKIEIAVSTKARQKMTLLMAKFERMEWLAYLVGDKDALIVEDIVIPKQRVTSVNVYVDEPVDIPIMGVIHSHHDMGNGFSHTDDSFINMNHDISLCITNTKITGQMRVKTECGRFMLADVVVVDAIDQFDVDDFLTEVNTQISEKAYTAPYNYGGGVGGAGGHVGGNAGGVNHSTNPSYGNTAGWADFGEEDCWDTEPPSATAKASREVLSEIKKYRDSLKGLTEVDDFYIVEFNMISGLIKSIGTPTYNMWEAKAFDEAETVFTEDYYRLIDEISLFSEELSTNECYQLNNLADELDKRCETDRAH